jgi:hypothetical protein
VMRIILQILWSQHVGARGGFQIQGSEYEILVTSRSDQHWRLHPMVGVDHEGDRFQQVHEEGEGRGGQHVSRVSGGEEEWKKAPK